MTRQQVIDTIRLHFDVCKAEFCTNPNADEWKTHDRELNEILAYWICDEPKPNLEDTLETGK